MAFSIIKKVYKFDTNFKQISDGIEIIQSHDRYNRAIDHYKKVVNEIRDEMTKEHRIISHDYPLGNDYVTTLTDDYESVDILFTDERNVIKYL